MRKLFNKPQEINEVFGGHQRLYKFNNGYGASVIQHYGSYGGPSGLWELAVLDGEEICYTTPITEDVIGHQTPEGIELLLNQIKDLR
jgi:hypothetical protein